MLDLYTWTTTNGRKPVIFLEEVGNLPYRIHPVDLGQKQHMAADFKALNPLAKIPALVDSEGPGGKPTTIIESNAILWYLAGKAGRLGGADEAARLTVMQWLMFQAANTGPTCSNLHFLRAVLPERPPSEVARHAREARRVFEALEARLGRTPWLGGDYSIADIAHYPHIKREADNNPEFKEFPKLLDWVARMDARPAVQKAMTMKMG